MREAPEELWTHRLLEVGRSLTAELDLDTVLKRVLQTAREITGARYAELGVLEDRRVDLEQFLMSGVDDDSRSADRADPDPRAGVGQPVPRREGRARGVQLPRRRGRCDPRRSGRRSRSATPGCTRSMSAAAESSRRRRAASRRPVTSRLRSAGRSRLAHILELIVKRGRALVGAGSLVIMLREGEELVVQASAGRVRELHGTRLPIADSTSGQVLEHLRPERITDVAARLARSVQTSSGCQMHRRRCWCRWSIAARRWACWRPSIAARTGACSVKTTSSCCARSR